MTAAPAGHGPLPARPDLTVVSSCRLCDAATTKVVDRDGTPVVFDAGPDGKAVRDPYGGWWIAKFRDRWTVVRPEPGEDPPTSGGGVRLREHDCAGPEVSLLRAVFGSVEVIATFAVAELPDVSDFPAVAELPDAPVAAGTSRVNGGPGVLGQGVQPGAKSLKEIRADGFFRPRARGRGIEGPACPERKVMTQAAVGREPPFQTGCHRCGRVTYRRDLDGVGWCGGYIPEPRHGAPWFPGRDTGYRVVDTV